MSGHAIAVVALYMAILTAAAWPLGVAIARVVQRTPGKAERLFFRICGVDPGVDMGWKSYTMALLAFNGVGFVVLLALQRLQGFLPLDPLGFRAVPFWVALNTAVSFVSNTNWQAYSGETTMSLLTQMAGLAVQNFLSAATGIAVLLAISRAFVRKTAEGIGNFWVDLTRATVYVLLPLSFVFALVLVGQGVPQTLRGSVEASGVVPAASRTIPLGPVASQVAIKQLGTNGGGFYNVNSAHPLENPTPLSNFLEAIAILLIPAALCFTFGTMTRRLRQGVALFVAMAVIFVPILVATIAVEERGPNMEGKEVRFGPAESALWAVATTAASNGSVNAMHDSFTALGGLGPMLLMQLGEVVFGGVGSGLYGMLLFVLVAVFLAGLMVGRTPEFLGKKIEAFEVQMAGIAILLPSACVLVGTAVACVVPAGRAATLNPGPHGFSEILYAFSSGANNNGSAFAGLTASGPFYAIAIAIVMAIGRYGVIVPVLAIAGSLARKKIVPVSPGTLPTDTPLFVTLLVATVVLVGALTFVPALALGPIVEGLQ